MDNEKAGDGDDGRKPFQKIVPPQPATGRLSGGPKRVELEVRAGERR
jgi:hypothetical protein